VYGPSGVSDVVGGFLQAYSRDQVYRTTHHSEQFMPKDGAKMRAHKVAPEIGNDFTVLEKAGLKITAITVDHAPVAPAVGYRFDYAGRSVVISGDTVYSKNLERASKGVDLLVHEVLQKAIIGSVSQAMADRGIDRLSKLSGDVLEYHTSPAEAVQLAREAGVRNLVFSHIVPPLPDRLARWIFFQDIGETGDTDVVLGHDGLHYRLAPDGETERDDLD
jgi:ribonuclease Z